MQQILSSFFSTLPAPTAAAPQVTEERTTKLQQDTMLEIAQKEERIAEFRKGMLDDEEALSYAEEDRRDCERTESEEDLFEAEASLTDEDLTYTRYDSESEIKALEEEIEELKEKL